MKRFQGLALVGAVLFTLSSTAFPQGSSSSLQGTVTDPSGSAIPGAVVVLANTASKFERSLATGPQGEYRLLAVPPGTYTLTVTAKGFSRYIQTGLELLVNTPATANVLLKVGTATENVTVTGEAPALNMVDASIGNPFDETQVKQIPLDARNVPDLLTLQAGVAYTGNRPDMDSQTYKDQDTRSGAVNGARSDQSNITLDGVDVNDLANGYAFTSVLPVTLDSVQEFRVTTTNYNADQGDGSGAQVALVTKSGTNTIHGSAYEYHRNTYTSASDYFLKAPPKLIRNIFGLSVGGPIKKDRAFFFANYEGTRRREATSVVRNIPTPSFLDGVIQYQCADAVACPNSGSVLGVSGKSYSYQPGYYALGPNEIGQFDPGSPQGIKGVNTALLNNYFKPTFGNFVPTETTVGDGLNYSGYRFAAPIKLDNNAYILRLDYHLTANGKHTLFWRGALQNVFNPEEPFLPFSGATPEHTLTDHSKGMAVGYIAILSPTLVNSFHYGFTRQSVSDGGNSDTKGWNIFYTLDQGVSYSRNFQLPVHNFVDDLSWTRGSHTFQFGGNLGIARDPRLSYQHSWNTALGATFWMAPVGFANTGGQSPLDPVNYTGDPNHPSGAPEPASSTQYDYPMLGLLGMVSDVKANINYDRQGNTLPEGTPIRRNYGLNWYEFYGQDSWRIKRNLTVTYGLRWSLFPPPWEVNGFQASPTFDLGKYFNQNAQNMKNGLGYADAPLVSFILGGPANHGTGLYQFEKSDFSPRISFAYSPHPVGGWLRKLVGDGDKTVIRGGFGRVYDRAGMQLINTFDANAPGGLGATVQNPCCLPGVTDAADVPRVTNINTVPVSYLTAQLPGGVLPPGQFPQTPNSAGEAITWGVDQSLKTPYAYTIDFSIGRDLSKQFSLQISYVGRLGRNLLTQRDLAQPLDLVDPKSKVDYYAAATALSKLSRNGVPVNQVTANSVGSTAAFWQNLIMPQGSSQPGLASGQSFVLPSGGTTNDVVQAVYALYTSADTYAGDEVVGLANVDIYYALYDTAANYYFFKGKPGELLNNQLTSMYAWSTVGESNYNGLQVNLTKRASHGVQFDLNYTYSKSIDITSGAARLGFSPSDNIGAPGSRLVNAFDPRGNRGVSDFDTTHQINANWIVELPFGRGKHFATNAGGATDAIIGGWQLSGLARWTTGFPFTVDNGQFWPTNWDEQGSATLVAKLKTGAFKQPDSNVSVFANPTDALNNGFSHTFPGGSGSRNVLRGQGYAGLDMSLSKRWKLPFEGHSLQFRWEVFNVPNLHRFNVMAGLGDGAPSLQQLPQAFGDYTGLLTQPRVMQFALRYEF
ncbi:MAG TPA: carboxypeptidase-like regulatory domain-containing protein [Candidatus Sulfotelmatobacter sp.]|nr:carboxypeptidase-like regulatory domain-containing protein [Candidatus Sulfotelmatobacter sp.]